jgi:hypothetical protein
MTAKRQSMPTITRGGSHPPQAVSAGNARTVQRTLALRVALDWSRKEDKALYNRLRDLGWQAAHYRNMMMRRRWAEALGYRVAESNDPHSVVKDGRKRDKGELSGDAYSCAENEVQGAWTRDGKRMLAGQPLAEWKPTAALSISGKNKAADSGIRLLREGDDYILRIRAQAATCNGGGWFSLPIKRGTDRDEYQAPILNRMVTWEIPIKKATVHMLQSKIIVKLTFPLTLPALPPIGERVAVLGPISKDGRLMLRTETQTKDYSSKLSFIVRLKDSWDKIRRRVQCQIGRRKGHARAKREALARESEPRIIDDRIHSWTAKMVDWCAKQGVGTIRVLPISTGDWPADRFIFRLKYKAEEAGIKVEEGSYVASSAAAERAAKSAINRRKSEAKKRSQAIRELADQLT